PMIGHRSKGFQDLYAEIRPKLQTLFGTKQQVFISTSSAWGIMEGSIRNLVKKKVLNCGCGAFSDKWYDVSQRCETSYHLSEKAPQPQLSTFFFTRFRIDPSMIPHADDVLMKTCCFVPKSVCSFGRISAYRS